MHLVSVHEGVQFDAGQGNNNLLCHDSMYGSARIGAEAMRNDRMARPWLLVSRFCRQQGSAMSSGRVDDRMRKGREQKQRRVRRRPLTLLFEASTLLVALTGGGNGFDWGVRVVVGFAGPYDISGYRTAWARDQSSRPCAQDAHPFRGSSTTELMMLLEDASVGCKGPKMRFEPPERVLIHWR